MVAKAPVAIRVNPDVDPKSHKKISTGQKSTKFGIAIDNGDAAEIYKYIHQSDHLIARGLAVHIGSQLTDLTPFRHAYQILIQLADDLRRQGYDVPILDLGGGLGDYRREELILRAMGRVAELFKDTDYQLASSGYSIAADNGVLLCFI